MPALVLLLCMQSPLPTPHTNGRHYSGPESVKDGAYMISPDWLVSTNNWLVPNSDWLVPNSDWLVHISDWLASTSDWLVRTC